MTVFGGLGGSQVVSSASGGKIYAYVNIGILGTIAPANPLRQSITFHNPGTKDILVGPASAFVGGGATTQTAFVPTTVNYGGCFRIFANGGSLTIQGECQQAWQALSVDGSIGNQFTVMDSNIG